MLNLLSGSHAPDDRFQLILAQKINIDNTFKYSFSTTLLSVAYFCTTFSSSVLI